MKLLVYILLSCLLIQACISEDTYDIEYSQFLHQEIEYRDSLYITHTILKWGENDWHFSDYSRMYKMTNDEIEYFFSGVFYSPDNKKMIIWIGRKLPNAPTITKYSEDPKSNHLCPYSPDTIYSVFPLIGIRNHQDSLWSLYPLSLRSGVCLSSKEKLTQLMANYYFRDMKTDFWHVRKTEKDKDYGGEVRYDLGKKQGKSSPYTFKTFGYNIQDDGFWEKSLLWQKGVLTEGRYIFEMVGGKDTRPYSFPEIEYPEEILELYDGDSSSNTTSPTIPE